MSHITQAEIDAAVIALINWFDSQGIKDSDAVIIMSDLIGSIHGSVAINVSDLERGLMTAMRVAARRGFVELVARGQK